jgi:hypothetical protein
MGAWIAMKRLLLALLTCCLFSFNSGCNDRPEVLEPGDNSESKYSETDFKNFEFEDSHPNCQASAECILMQVGGCMNVRAIHVSEVELAEAYTVYAKDLHSNVQCAPDLPIEEYEALCLNQKCKETPRHYRLLVEVPEQPVEGQPFWVGMSFRFPIAAEMAYARFNFPENIDVISGQTEWIGPLEALEERVMWVQVQVNRTGEVNLNGWAGVQRGNTAISPLSWGKKFTVVRTGDLTPQAAERIIATPTAVN